VPYNIEKYGVPWHVRIRKCLSFNMFQKQINNIARYIC
jgi:hypothetical protein